MSGAKAPSSEHDDGGLGVLSPPHPRLSSSNPHSHSKNHPISFRTVGALQMQLQGKSSSLLLRKLSPLFPSYVGILELPPYKESPSPGVQETPNSTPAVWSGGGMMLNLAPSCFLAGPPGPRFPICEMESGLQLISSHGKAWGGGSPGLLLQSLAIRTIDAPTGAAKGRGPGQAPVPHQ